MNMSRKTIVENREQVKNAFLTYFDMGGLQLNINCFSKGDLEKALEISCNPYFINLAIETGGEKILETAKNLGFGDPSCFGENWFSASGNLPSEEELLSKTVLASFAFGQGKLLATPIQLAVLSSAIANGGKAVTPKLVLGTYDKEGNFE